MNTLSEIEGYYKKREQRLLKKLHQQEVALDAANQKLAQLIRNQTAQLDETTEQRAAHDQKLKEELYKAIWEYQQRERRFGKTSEQIS